MKLLVVSHAYQSGQYLPTLKAMASCKGVDLGLVCPESYQGQSPDWNSHGILERFAIPISFGDRQGAFLYQPNALARSVADFRPDLILHEQEAYTLGAGQMAAFASRLRIPLVLFVWENVHRRLLLLRRWEVSFVLRKSAGLIAGSEDALKVHRDWKFEGLAEVVPQMGVETNPSPVIGRRDQNALRVCYIGRLVSCKGIDCLIQAVHGLKEKGIPVQCSIAGSGGELKSLIDLSQSLGMQSEVTFRGFLSGESLRRQFQECDVLVLPSRRSRTWSEQFGRVLIEAMAHSCVPVGSRTGAIPEVIASEDLTFEEGDHRGLSSILEKIYKSPEFLGEHQRRAWHRANSIYSNSYLAEKRVRFLRAVLETVS